MKLKTVTFTGVDDSTDLSEIAALSRDYPFAEWGVLLSPSRTGRDKRYPHLDTLHRIGNMAGLPTAVHLCGAFSRDFAEGKGTIGTMVSHLVRNAGRIQVNLGRGIDRHSGISETASGFFQRNGIPIILQSYSFQSPAVTYTVGKRAANQKFVTFLHDASGGQGIVGEFEKPINGDFVGFAGGITPENVTQKLGEIDALGIDNACWIDMESGVRTDDLLDLSKVRQVLETVAPFISHEGTIYGVKGGQ